MSEAGHDGAFPLATAAAFGAAASNISAGPAATPAAAVTMSPAAAVAPRGGTSGIYDAAAASLVLKKELVADDTGDTIKKPAETLATIEKHFPKSGHLYEAAVSQRGPPGSAVICSSQISAAGVAVFGSHPSESDEGWGAQQTTTARSSSSSHASINTRTRDGGGSFERSTGDIDRRSGTPDSSSGSSIGGSSSNSSSMRGSSGSGTRTCSSTSSISEQRVPSSSSSSTLSRSTSSILARSRPMETSTSVVSSSSSSSKSVGVSNSVREEEGLLGSILEVLKDRYSVDSATLVSLKRAVAAAADAKSRTETHGRPVVDQHEAASFSASDLQQQQQQHSRDSESATTLNHEAAATSLSSAYPRPVAPAGESAEASQGAGGGSRIAPTTATTITPAKTTRVNRADSAGVTAKERSSDIGVRSGRDTFNSVSMHSKDDRCGVSQQLQRAVAAAATAPSMKTNPPVSAWAAGSNVTVEGLRKSGSAGAAAAATTARLPSRVTSSIRYNMGGKISNLRGSSSSSHRGSSGADNDTRGMQRHVDSSSGGMLLRATRGQDDKGSSGRDSNTMRSTSKAAADATLTTYEHVYNRFVVWVLACTEESRDELMDVAFAVLLHMFRKLLTMGEPLKAWQLLRRCAYPHATRHKELLQQLEKQQVVHTLQLREIPYFSAAEWHPLFISQSAYQLLRARLLETRSLLLEVMIQASVRLLPLSPPVQQQQSAGVVMKPRGGLVYPVERLHTGPGPTPSPLQSAQQQFRAETSAAKLGGGATASSLTLREGGEATGPASTCIADSSNITGASRSDGSGSGGATYEEQKKKKLLGIVDDSSNATEVPPVFWGLPRQFCREEYIVSGRGSEKLRRVRIIGGENLRDADLVDSRCLLPLPEPNQEAFLLYKRLLKQQSERRAHLSAAGGQLPSIACISVLNASSDLSACAISPSTSKMVALGGEGEILLWNLQEYEVAKARREQRRRRRLQAVQQQAEEGVSLSVSRALFSSSSSSTSSSWSSSSSSSGGSSSSSSDDDDDDDNEVIRRKRDGRGDGRGRSSGRYKDKRRRHKESYRDDERGRRRRRRPKHRERKEAKEDYLHNNVAGGSRRLIGAEGRVLSLAFGELDDRILLSGGVDGVIRLWQTYDLASWGAAGDETALLPDLEREAKLMGITGRRGRRGGAGGGGTWGMGGGGLSDRGRRLAEYFHKKKHRRVFSEYCNDENNDDTADIHALSQQHFRRRQQYTRHPASGEFVSTRPTDIVVPLCLYRGGLAAVWSVDTGPYGHYFASGSSDGFARLWCTSRSYPLRLLPHPGAVAADVFYVRFHPNSSLLLTAAADACIRLFDLRTAEQARFWVPNAAVAAAVAAGAGATAYRQQQQSKYSSLPYDERTAHERRYRQHSQQSCRDNRVSNNNGNITSNDSRSRNNPNSTVNISSTSSSSSSTGLGVRNDLGRESGTEDKRKQKDIEKQCNILQVNVTSGASDIVSTVNNMPSAGGSTLSAANCMTASSAASGVISGGGCSGASTMASAGGNILLSVAGGSHGGISAAKKTTSTAEDGTTVAGTAVSSSPQIPSSSSSSFPSTTTTSADSNLRSHQKQSNKASTVRDDLHGLAAATASAPPPAGSYTSANYYSTKFSPRTSLSPLNIINPSYITRLSSIAVSPNGRLVAVAGDEGSICVYDIPTAKLLAVGGIYADCPVAPAVSLSFCRGSVLLAAACKDGTVSLYDTSTAGLRGTSTYSAEIAATGAVTPLRLVQAFGASNMAFRSCLFTPENLLVCLGISTLGESVDGFLPV